MDNPPFKIPSFKGKSLKHSHLSRTNLIVSILVFGTIGAYALFQSSAAATSANIWVDANGGTCTRTASPAAYVDSAACGSFDAANDKCQSGDQVIIKAGSYGNQTLSGSNSRTSPCKIDTAQGETVTMAQFNNGEIGGGDTGADWITFTGPITANEVDSDQTANVVLDNWNVTVGGAVATQPFHVEGTQGPFTLKNSKVHGVMNANAMMYISGSGPWLFDNNDLYESLDNTDGTIHTECMYATSVANMTFTRNHLWSCATEDIFITGSELATNWDVENNIFEHPLGPNSNALAFRSGSAPSPSPDGFILKYNTFGREAGVQINTTDNQVTANGFTVIGNFFSTQAPCGMANTTYSYNAFVTGEQCGTNAVTNSLANYLSGFTNPHNATANSGAAAEAPGDYHILVSSPLKDTANPSSFPSLDRDGTARYVGAAPDIGAYEYGGTAGPVANLWVDTNGGTCTRQAVAGAYSDAAACGSLGAAYTAAAAGDKVLVKAGTYTVSFTGTKGSNGAAPVVFEDETPYNATISSLGFGTTTNNITLQNFNVNTAVYEGDGYTTPYITFKNNRFFYGTANTGAQVFNLHTVQHWTFDGNIFGPWCCSSVANNSPEAIRLGSSPPSTPAVGDCSHESCYITIKNNLFQYIGRTQTLWPTTGWGPVPDTTCSNVGDTCHMDGIHVFGAQNVDILNNRFYGVECQAIFFEQGGPPTMNANINIIGNAISSVSGGCGNAGIILEFASGGGAFGGTWNIAFNSGTSYIHAGDSGLSSFIAGSHLNYAGNYINNQTCNSSTANVTVTYSYNLWRNSACGGATNTTGTTPSFIDSNGSPDPNIDVHLAGSTGTAIDFVPSSFCSSNPTLCPATDIDGNNRPQGSAYDAGADEYFLGASTKLGDLNNDNSINVLDLSILLSHYGQSATASQGDLNSDNQCTVTDLSILLSHWGQ